MTTTKEFVTALRGPEGLPAEISPISYLRTAILTLTDLKRAQSERAEDPDAYDEMVAEVWSLYNKLKTLAAQHSAQTGAPLEPKPVPGMDLSPEARRLMEQLRHLDFSPEAMEALEHLRQMGANVTNGAEE